MAVIPELLEKLGLVAKDAPIDPENIGVNEIGAEEKVIDDWKIIASEIYPAAYEYDGPALVENIKFKGVALMSLKPDWLLKSVIWLQARNADVTPLKAVLRERRIKTPYFPDIFSEYELEFHYHDSPIVMMVGLLIIGVLVAAGFVILAHKAPSGEDWKKLTKDVKSAFSAITASIFGIGGIYLLSKFK